MQEALKGRFGWPLLRSVFTHLLDTRFLVELRKLAYQSQDIPNVTLYKMSHKAALLGVRRSKTEGKGWDYEHKFLTRDWVTIVDDIDDYQLFSDSLFIAPQEETLERAC